MNGTATLRREQQRNLKKEIGATAASAVADVRQLVDTISLEHQVLARQMLEFERTVATVKEARALDKKSAEAAAAVIAEQLENIDARLAQQTARLTQLNRIWCDGLQLEQRRNDRFEQLTLWQRLWWMATGGLPSELDAGAAPALTPLTPETRPSTMEQRAMDFAALRPGERNPYVDPAYPGDGV